MALQPRRPYRPAAIVLDVSLARREEGGPVFDPPARVSACRPSGRAARSFAITDRNRRRIVPLLLKDAASRAVARVALQAVAVPDALREDRPISQRLDGDVGR